MSRKYSASRIIAALPVGVAVARDGKLVFVNPRLEEILRTPAAKLLGTDGFSIVAPEDRDRVKERYEARLRGEEVPRSYEVTLVGADGERHPCEIEPVVVDPSETVISVRSLGERVRDRELLVALAELQAQVQRERTVQGILEVTTHGLNAIGFPSSVARLVDGMVRLVAPPAGSPAELVMQVLFRREGNTFVAPVDSTPLLKGVVLEQRPLWIDDLFAAIAGYLRNVALPDPGAPTLELARRLRLVMAPIRARERPFGALITSGENLRSNDAAALSLFAQQLGSMLEVAQNIEELERQNRVLETIHKVAGFGTEGEVTALVPELLELVVETTGSDDAAMYLVEPDSEWLTLVGSTIPGALEDRWRRMSLQRTATGRAALSLRPAAISVHALPAVAREDLAAQGFVEIAIVPLVVSGRLAGTLNLVRRRHAPYTEEELRATEMLMAQVAIQVERARLSAETRRRVEDLSLINEVGSLIAQHLQLEDVMTVAVRHLTRIAAVENTFLMLLDDSRQELRVVASSVPHLVPGELVLKMSEPSASAEAVRTGKPVTIEDSTTDPRVAKAVSRRFGHRALLSVPLVADGRPLGAVILGDTRAGRRFTAEEVDRVVAIANQLASAIANARLFEDVQQSYRELSRTQAELVKREKLAALGELSAVVAHEVRNPLGVIFNSMASLRRIEGLTESSQRLLAIMGEEAERLNRMVSDLLDFARPHEARLRRENLEPVLALALDAAARVIPSADVTLSLQVAAELPEVPVDGYMLRQAVVNLVVNAIQAMPKGGEVVVRAGLDQRNGQPFARVDVADDGPGIQAEVAEKIFQPFFTTRAAGTGLGLAVVKRIAEAHHADLAVLTEPGRGATFSMWLPLRGEGFSSG